MESSAAGRVPTAVTPDQWAERLGRAMFAERLVSGRRVLHLVRDADAQRLPETALLARAAHEVVLAILGMDGASTADVAQGAADPSRATATLPYPDAAFDVVVAFEVLDQLYDSRHLIDEIRRVLSPSGLLVVSTPGHVYASEDEREPFDADDDLALEALTSALQRAFPRVGLYHGPQVALMAPDPSGLEDSLLARDVGLDPAVRAAHWAVAVCSAGPLPIEGIVFMQTGWAALRRYVRTLRSDRAVLRAERDQSLHRLHEMQAELHRTQRDYRSLEQEMESVRRLVPPPPAPSPPPTFSERAVRGALTLGAATLAVPIAGMVGAGTVATELLGRSLPRTRSLDALAPLDPTLATLLVLNFNGRDLLAKNIPSLQASIARTGRAHQILIVDNGSKDGSADFARRTFPDIDVVDFPHNYFFSAGNDRGMRHVRHDIVVLLNNDMRVEPDFLEPLLRPFEGDRSVFAVASQILMAGKRQEETGLTRGRFVRGRLELRHDPVPPGSQTVPILWGGGGACAFDRRKFVDIGGLDVLYDPFYCEDLDLSLRAWSRGWKVLFAPESKVWHDHRTTSRRVFGEDFVNETLRRNVYLLLWANLRDSDLLLEHLLVLPAIAASQVREHGMSGVRSLVRAAGRAPRALARRLRERGDDGPSLATVLERTDVGLDPTATRERARAYRPDKPLRITMLSPYHVYPVQHGGAVRMYHVLRELARRGHDVSLVGFVDSEEQREAGQHLREFCSDVELLVRKPGVAHGRHLTPGEVREFDHHELRSVLAAHLESRNVDVLQVEYTHMAPYGRLARPRLACLTEHDVAFMSRYRHAAAAPSWSAALKAYVNYLRMFHYELAALRGFDVVFAMSPKDAQILRAYLGSGVHVSDRAPIGADTAGFGKIERAPAPGMLLFVGNFGHTPNVDAVRWFAREVLPSLLRRRPDLRVVLAGPHPPPDIVRLAEDRRIEVPGFVPDLKPLYANATAFIAPIRVVAGVRVKLLEAFAARVPVVSTQAAAEGLDVVHGRELLLAESAAEFVEQTLRLLGDPFLGQTLAARARRAVEERYDWSAIAAAIEDEYRTALGRNELRTQ